MKLVGSEKRYKVELDEQDRKDLIRQLELAKEFIAIKDKDGMRLPDGFKCKEFNTAVLEFLKELPTI